MQDFLNRVQSTPIWNQEFINNTLGDYVTTLLVLLGLVIIFWIFQRLIVKRLEKIAEHTKTEIDNAVIGMIETLRPSFYTFLAFYLSVKLLAIGEALQRTLNVIFVVLIIYQVIRAIHVGLDYGFKRRIEGGDPGAVGMVDFMNKMIKGVLWMVGLLLVLSNLGINISSLIAGLGIGGIAIALALQNILGDLFSSFAIYLDKPFEIGDYIVVGTEKGHVEKVGVKTTRIRALGGEQIIISNKELTSARIQNFKRMKERRKTFTFGVIYETPQKALERIPAIIEKIINASELARFDRVYFSEFGDSALVFEVAYYTQSRKFQDFAATHQEILLAINKEFTAEKISIAYPTRTLYVNKI
jgi:small-conductance mechanosensitive channel